MKKKKTVIIVDEQYDFCRGGRLEVSGSTRAVSGTCRFLERHKDEIERVVLTADWHPADHCSFQEQGGTWVKHCVQYSHGAAIHERLLQALHRLGLPYEVATKGTDKHKEEYGGFSEPQKQFEDQDLWVMGLAGDYCVMETSLNLLKSAPYRISLYGPGISSINTKEFFRLVDKHSAEHPNFRLVKNP